MILKKPYAFIIKHFRLIHLILFGCVVYITIFLSDIHSLFKTLHVNNTFIYEQGITHINKTVYLIIFIGLIMGAIIYWLLRIKKKPTNLYLFFMGYLILVFAAFFYFYYVIKSMSVAMVKIESITFVEDISLLATIPAYALMVLFLVRGIGFDLKKFNFSKDIKELEIASNDSAEFELLIGQNNYKYWRAFRRFKRESKYFILENKFVISCIFIGIVIASSLIGFNYYNKYMKKLSEEESTIVNGIAYTIRNSYITKYDYKGDLIKKGYKYVVLDMSFFNNSINPTSLDTSLISLNRNELRYYPILTKNANFYDIGIPYEKGEKLANNQATDRTLAFEIPETMRGTNFVLKVQYDYEVTKKGIVTRYRNFNVRAKDIDEEVEDTYININERIDSNVLDINKIEVVVKGFQVVDSYDAKYITCKDLTNCSPYSRVISSTTDSLNTMLVIDYSLINYDDARFTKTFNTNYKILSNYCKVGYDAVGGYKEEEVKMINNSEVDGKAFFSVNRKVATSRELNLIFNFRNNKYIVPLRTLTEND